MKKSVTCRIWAMLIGVAAIASFVQRRCLSGVCNPLPMRCNGFSMSDKGPAASIQLALSVWLELAMTVPLGPSLFTRFLASCRRNTFCISARIFLAHQRPFVAHESFTLSKRTWILWLIIHVIQLTIFVFIQPATCTDQWPCYFLPLTKMIHSIQQLIDWKHIKSMISTE